MTDPDTDRDESTATRALEQFALEFRKCSVALVDGCEHSRKATVERLDRMATLALTRLWHVRDFESRTSRLIDDEKPAEARALLEEAKSTCGNEPEFSRLESILWFLERPITDDGRTPDVSSGETEAS